MNCDASAFAGSYAHYADPAACVTPNALLRIKAGDPGTQFLTLHTVYTLQYLAVTITQLSVALLLLLRLYDYVPVQETIQLYQESGRCLSYVGFVFFL